MSVIIVGGHERMESVYKKVGKKYGCKVKVFTHMETNFQKRIGNADYIFMLSDVVSHKLVNTAMKVSKQRKIPRKRLINGSLTTVEDTFREVKAI
ncbi:MAG: DUF2325 domain-containing protein [Peptostreptococcaceae bacterium]|jgi:hypothetical protein|nr:DUF2325 domain-containing protein [Peptostreptococcaceae bacterium]